MKKIYIFGIVVIILAAAAIICINGNKGRTDAYYGSNIYADGNFAYFNNYDNDLMQKDLGEGVTKVICKNSRMVAADEYFFAVEAADGTLNIINHEGVCQYEGLNIQGDSYDIYKDFIYYNNKADNNKIYRSSFDGKLNEKVCDYSTEKLKVTNDIVYFEFNKNAVCSWTLADNQFKEIYKGQYCYYFQVFNDKIYLSDYSKENNLAVINANNGEFEKQINCRTCNFFVSSDGIYYFLYKDEDIQAENPNSDLMYISEKEYIDGQQ